MARTDGFFECWHGRNECSFVIELGQLYFCVASDATIGTIESSLSCRNLGVSYIFLGLIEVDAKVKPYFSAAGR